MNTSILLSENKFDLNSMQLKKMELNRVEWRLLARAIACNWVVFSGRTAFVSDGIYREGGSRVVAGW